MTNPKQFQLIYQEWKFDNYRLIFSLLSLGQNGKIKVEQLKDLLLLAEPEPSPRKQEIEWLKTKFLKVGEEDISLGRAMEMLRIRLHYTHICSKMEASYRENLPDAKIVKLLNRMPTCEPNDIVMNLATEFVRTTRCVYWNDYIAELDQGIQVPKSKNLDRSRQLNKIQAASDLFTIRDTEGTLGCMLLCFK